jgi:hypothetical protein
MRLKHYQEKVLMELKANLSALDDAQKSLTKSLNSNHIWQNILILIRL